MSQDIGGLLSTYYDNGYESRFRNRRESIV